MQCLAFVVLVYFNMDINDATGINDLNYSISVASLFCCQNIDLDSTHAINNIMIDY